MRKDYPKIIKQGTIDLDIVETTPIVFHDRLYRFEYIRQSYHENTTGDSYSRFVDVERGDTTRGFARSYHLGSAYVWQDTVYVTAVPGWGANKITVFVSADLENWNSREALYLPDNTIFNTSLCRNDSIFVLMYEIGAPFEEAGDPFTARFAYSEDLLTWKRTPKEMVFSKQGYQAPHALRYCNGYYYNFYLKQFLLSYQTFVARSKDLINWELSKGNPVLKASTTDKTPFMHNFSDDQLDYISKAKNINNSDIDFCYFKGQMIIFYSWGDQHGKEFLAQAYCLSTQEDFLEGWFED